MAIDSILVYHFVDPDLTVEMFSEKKEGAAENGGVGTFIRSLLNYFDIPSYGSESKKRYTLTH